MKLEGKENVVTFADVKQKKILKIQLVLYFHPGHLTFEPVKFLSIDLTTDSTAIFDFELQ